MQVHQAEPGWQQLVFMLIAVAIVLALRGRRLMRVRPIEPEKLWIVPAIYFAVVCLIFFRTPPSPIGWLVCALALPVGAALGWQRGKTMRLHIDSASGKLMQQGSFWAFGIIAALVIIKMITPLEGRALHFDVNLIGDGLAAFSLGLFSVQRLEMYLRAKTLLAGARA